MIGSECAIAGSLERPAVRVQCVAATLSDRDTQTLCQQAVQSLAQVMPEAALRQVAAWQWQPYADTDVSVLLEMSARAGKLLWQVGPMGELHTGLDIPFYATAGMPAADLRKFTDDLVTSTYPMLAETRAKALK